MFHSFCFFHAQTKNKELHKRSLPTWAGCCRQLWISGSENAHMTSSTHLAVLSPHTQCCCQSPVLQGGEWELRLRWCRCFWEVKLIWTWSFIFFYLLLQGSTAFNISNRVQYLSNDDETIICLSSNLVKPFDTVFWRVSCPTLPWQTVAHFSQCLVGSIIFL